MKKSEGKDCHIQEQLAFRFSASCPLEEAVRASTQHHDSYHATTATEYLPMICSRAPMPPLRLISGPLPSLDQDK